MTFFFSSSQHLENKWATLNRLSREQNRLVGSTKIMDLDGLGMVLPFFFFSKTKIAVQYNGYLVGLVKGRSGAFVVIIVLLGCLFSGYKHMHKVGFTYFREMITMSQANYPEMLNKLYTITIFKFLFIYFFNRIFFFQYIINYTKNILHKNKSRTRAYVGTMIF